MCRLGLVGQELVFGFGCWGDERGINDLASTSLGVWALFHTGIRCEITPDDEVGGPSIKASRANHRSLMLREESWDAHVFPGTHGFPVSNDESF